MPEYYEDENGYVTFPNTMLSKPGVFPYLGREISPELDPDRVYNVYRPESELNNPETIESFKLSPWFPRHEMAGESFTAAEDIGVQGTTGQDVHYKKGAGLVGTVKTFGTSLKSAIQAGLRELSCGFRCTWDIVGGTTPDGLRYDVVQRNIRGNHLASVEEGRMGSQFSVAMDRACIALDSLTIEEGLEMTLEEMLQKVRDAEPAKEELAKLYAEIGAMLGDGEQAVAAGAEEAVAAGAEKPEEEGEGKVYDSEAMDAMAKTIAGLQKQVKQLSGKAMDSDTIERQITEKQNLVKELEPVIGRIDGTGLDAAGVAKKAAEIIGIACDSGSALAAVRGYLHARKNAGTTIDSGTAQDAASAAAVVSKLEEMGL